MSIHKDRILYEDDSLLAVNKLAGELVVKGSGTMDKLPLLDLLKKDYPGLRAVHRLDFETSGVVVFAKNKKAEASILDTKFAQWTKVYRTLVMGRMPKNEGGVHFPLSARTGKGKVEAHTHYFVLERFANSSYVEARIETGRHHQIRKHFAMIHHPLVLDQEYGHEKFNRVFRQEFHLKKFFLHAFSLTFPHPETGKMIRIEAPMPKQFLGILKKLRSLS